MVLSETINRVVHPLVIKWVLKTYNNKMDRRAKVYPELFKPVDDKLTKKHLELWRRLGLPCNDKWLRFFTNLTGIEDYCYCPEDLYFARIERILNDCNRAGSECEDKNLIDLYVGDNVAPRAYLRYVRGFWFDEEGHCIPEKMAADILTATSSKGGIIVAENQGNGVYRVVSIYVDFTIDGAVCRVGDVTGINNIRFLEMVWMGKNIIIGFYII